MKTLILAALGAAVLAPAPTFAQSAFDGTWKFDMASAQLAKKPEVYLLKDGVFQCSTCVPPIKVRADGAFHPVAGSPYYDAYSVTVVNDHTYKQAQRKGQKVVSTGTLVISADGKSASAEYSDGSATNGAPVTGKFIMTRVAAAPPGSAPISGSWRMATIASVSSNGLFETFKVNGDMLSMSEPTGQSYIAKLDGTEAPFKGDPGTSSVSVQKTGAKEIVETDKRSGKVIDVIKMTVSPDGKTMKIGIDDKLQGTTSAYKAMKQ